MDLKADGPTVIEVPPKQQGILDDFWHRPLTDVGYVGPDKGEGGKYLILPPDYEGETPEGFFTFNTLTGTQHVTLTGTDHDFPWKTWSVLFYF